MMYRWLSYCSRCRRRNSQIWKARDTACDAEDVIPIQSVKPIVTFTAIHIVDAGIVIVDIVVARANPDHFGTFDLLWGNSLTIQEFTSGINIVNV
jgi:hypothetical protein